MRIIIAVVLSIFVVSSTMAGQYAAEANDNPFIDGGLNAKYAGEATALAGKIIGIKTISSNKLYKLNLNLDGANDIWVANFIKPQGKKLELGDEVIFKGYITVCAELDESGNLEKAIQSKTLLLSVFVRNLNV